MPVRVRQRAPRPSSGTARAVPFGSHRPDERRSDASRLRARWSPSRCSNRNVPSRAERSEKPSSTGSPKDSPTRRFADPNRPGTAPPGHGLFPGARTPLRADRPRRTSRSAVRRRCFSTLRARPSCDPGLATPSERSPPAISRDRPKVMRTKCRFIGKKSLHPANDHL